MARYDTVLFDLDGTLIDSIRLILDSFHHTFAAFGRAPRTDAEWLAGIGTPLTIAFQPWARDAAEIDAMILAYREHNLHHHDAVVRAYPGVVAVVTTLAERGMRLGIVTSKNRHSTHRGLVAAGLDAILTRRVCSEDVTRHKPDREPVDRGVALCSADPGRTLFVGDSVHDMHAGKAAGVDTAAALWGPFTRADLAPAEPRHWLDSPEHLLATALG